MRLVIVPAAAALFLLASAAHAQTEGAAQPAAEPAPPVADEAVCRIEPPVIGSRLGARKVCKTRAEWSASERGSGSVTDNPGVNVHAGRGLPSEGAARTPGN